MKHGLILVLFLALTSFTTFAASGEPEYPVTLQKGWMNGKNCAWIISGLQYSNSEFFALMPHGQLSSTLKAFHPAKIDRTAAGYSETPLSDRVVEVKAEAFGGTVERRFEKLPNGSFRPAYAGRFTSTYTETDPIFGVVTLEYQADAATLQLNSGNQQELKQLERKLQSLFTSLTSPMKAQALADFLNGAEDVSGQYEVVVPAICEEEADEDEWGCPTSLWKQPTEEDIFQKLFQFGLKEDLTLQLSVTLDEDVLHISGKDYDGVSYGITVDYSPDDDEYGFPVRVRAQISHYRIALAMDAQFKDRLNLSEMLESGEQLAMQAQQEKLQSDALWAKAGTRYADGYSKKRNIDGEEVTIFKAKRKDPFQGRIFYELVPFELQIPDFFEINGRLFQVADKFPPGRRFALIDVETGKVYRGTIRCHDIAHPYLLDITNYVVSMPPEIIGVKKATD